MPSPHLSSSPHDTPLLGINSTLLLTPIHSDFVYAENSGFTFTQRYVAALVSRLALGTFLSGSAPTPTTLTAFLPV